MAITLWTGQPGAGKTSAMVDHLSKLPGDRPIYVHYDPASKRRPDQVLLSESLKIPHIPCNVNDWHTSVPDGSIVIVDEVQDVWRPRGSTAKVPDAVAALETHRHGGIDFFLTTQAPRLLDANVRGLVARHVHIRDTGWLGRHVYEWPECNDGLSWKTCPVKKKFKLSKKAFDLYHSASSHHATARTTPVILYVAILSILIFAALAFASYRVIKSKGEPALAVKTPVVVHEASTGKPLAHAVDVVPYDASIFIPRISNKPESAPAYDHLRVVVAMPQVVGGYCVNGQCKCLTNQATDAGLSSHECARWIENKPFDPYRVATIAASGVPSGGTASNASPAARGSSAVETVSVPFASMPAPARL